MLAPIHIVEKPHERRETRNQAVPGSAVRSIATELVPVRRSGCVTPPGFGPARGCYPLTMGVTGGGTLCLLRRERRPVAALAAALLLFHSLVMALGLASQAAAATGSAIPFFVICSPGSDSPSGDDDGSGDAEKLHFGQPCALCQPQAGPEAPAELPRPKMRPRAPNGRPARAVPAIRVKRHLRPPNRAPPAYPHSP